MPAIPATMHVVATTAVSTLADCEIPVPKPLKNEVLVKVAASGVNPIDWKNLDNHIPLGKKLPAILGCDLAGTVAAIGEDVSEFQVGDEVFGMTAGMGSGPEGTLAEYAIAHEISLTKKPSNLTMRQAAAFPLALLTAWEPIVVRHNINAGVALVTGASGGVGQFAVQLLTQRGVHVFGLASPGKRDAVERYGATFIDYNKPDDVKKAVQEHTKNGRGFDYIFDCVGGEWLNRAFEYVAPLGCISTINGFATHLLATVALKAVTLSFPMICIPTLFPEPQFRTYIGAMLRDSAPLIEQGKLVVMVDDEHRYPFSKEGVERTYAALMAHNNRGKLVVDIE